MKKKRFTSLPITNIHQATSSNSEDDTIKPTPTSFHSGCIVHFPFHKLIIVAGCFDIGDEMDGEAQTNDVMAFNYLDREWSFLYERYPTTEEVEVEINEQLGITRVQISATESQLLSSSLQTTEQEESNVE